MSDKPNHILRAAFAVPEPFLSASIEDAGEPNRWLLTVELDPERALHSRARRKLTIPVFYDPEGQILSYRNQDPIPFEAVRTRLESVANKLNLRDSVLSRVAILEADPPQLVSIFSTDISYIDPNRVTGFERPMRLEVEFFINETIANLRDLAVLLVS